jgi:hypothetical protein
LFRKVEFTETADGNCRLKAPLTHELAETLPRWSQALAPIAEQVAHSLGQAMAGKYISVTPLIGDSSRQAQAVVKARKSAARGAGRSTTTTQRAARGTVAPWSYRDCGGQVTDHRHVRCDACFAVHPRQTPELRGQRGAAIATRKRTQREWEEAHTGTQEPDPDYFSREVLPGLSRVKLADLMTAADIPRRSRRKFEQASSHPNESTWANLAALAETNASVGHGTLMR